MVIFGIVTGDGGFSLLGNFKDIPSIVPVILDENAKIEVYDIIIQEDNNERMVK